GVCAGLLVLMAFMVKPEALKGADLKSVLLLVAGGFLANIVAQLFFYKGLETGQLSRIVPVVGTYPLVSFVLGIVFLGEPITLAKAGGVACIMSGLWLLNVR
ncbi:MAG: DMT family transporter, partial [Candidatus Omnitrophica bacterium]|nr:DMT family transporter [Candidatus Omnitrophota bacterium]